MKNYGLSNLNSTLLALLIYFCVVFFVFFKLVYESTPAVQYTDIKDSFIDIEFAASLPQSNFKQENLNTPQELNIEELFSQTTNKEIKTEDIDQKASNFDELFGNLKDIQEEKTTKIQSSAKSAQASALKPQASELIKKLNENLIQNESLADTQSVQAQRVGIYDEFLGKISRIINQRWSQYYPNSEKIEVIVKIFIDENGNFGYTSVQKSGNALYDSKVNEFLENQKGKFITYPPQDKSINVIMVLKDDAQINN